MATGYQGAEPPSKFCEVVRVGRLQGGRRIEPHEVTVFYKYKSGRAGKSNALISRLFYDLITRTLPYLLWYFYRI